MFVIPLKNKFQFMTVVIKRKSSLREIAKAKKLLRRKKNISQGLEKHFGALRRGIDGLSYQKEIRNEWH